jgi:FkbM family methyltransferase
MLSRCIKKTLVHLFGSFPFRFELPNDRNSGLKIFGSLEARFGYLRGKRSVDQILIDFVEAFVDRPNLVVWDVGANVGIFGFMASAAGAKSVLLFEPDLHSCSLMLRTKQSNSAYDSCQIMPFAITDGLGMSQFGFSTQGGAANRLTEFSGARANGGSETFHCMVPVLSAEFLLPIHTLISRGMLRPS